MIEKYKTDDQDLGAIRGIGLFIFVWAGLTFCLAFIMQIVFWILGSG